MRLFTLMLAVLVSGCAEFLSPNELAEESPSLRTQHAALRKCSQGPWWDRCPSGQHIAWVTNDESCPSRYAYACEADTSSFQACGLGCPYGYHSTRYDWTPSCYQRGGVEPNITSCERNDWPRPFHMCGGGCPAGWHDKARDRDITCFTSTTSNSMTANATSCAANDGPAFTLCKTLLQSSCPGGYDRDTEYHDPNCDVFGASAPGTLNAISCSRRPPKLSSVRLDQYTVRGGAELTGRVVLDGKAEEMGATVTLISSDTKAVHVPSTVSITHRAYEVSFPIRTSIVTSQKEVKITAMFNGRTEEWPLTLTPLPTLSSVSVETFPPGSPPATIQGAVFLDGEAQGSTKVSLSSDRGEASVPDFVIVPDGKRGAVFTVTLSPVDVDTPVTLTARIGTVTQSTTLTLPVPPAIPPGPLGKAIFQDAGCNAHSLPATDNGSTGPVTLPFPINFHGALYNHVFINNNGNVTFEAPHDWTFAWDVALGGYFEPVESTIAAFYADVDTRGAGSNVVRYGEVNFGGYRAFCVNWLDVGYFNSHSDKLNSFQLLLVQRNDVGLNDFDIYLNYGSVQWDCVDDDIYCGWGGTTVTAGYWAVPVHGSTGFRYSYRIPGAWPRGTWLDNSGSPHSLIHSAHNSLLPGRYIFPIRNGAPATLGTLAGRVTDTASMPMAKALVEVCPVRAEEGLCTTVTTDGAQGTYSVNWLPEGDYTITAYPSSRSHALRQTVGPEPVRAGVTRNKDITLPLPLRMPPEVSLSPATTGDNGVSIVNSQDELDLSVPGCAKGTASYSVQRGSTVFVSGSMLEAPEGTYSAHIPPLDSNSGPAQVSVTMTCPSISAQPVVFDIYIAPSSTVRTFQGRPVRDALVTLYRADKPEGPFTVVPAGSAIMSPLNRTNPDVTDTQGRFHWDVISGYYKVRAEREGCLSLSGDPYAESEVLPVPPVTDLDLRLDCPGLDDLTSPGSSASLSPPANAHGWNNTEVQVLLTATDDDSGVEALVCTLSGAQPGGIIMHGPGAEALIATEGETTVSWFAYDAAGNPEQSQSVQVRIDQTPPSSSARLSSPANDKGWHTGPVTVELSATDLGSGIEELVYTLSGAQSGTATVPGGSASVTVSAQGMSTLSWYSRDLAGNQELAHSLQIRIESRTPTLSCEASPAELWPPNHKLIPVQVHAWFDNASPGSAGTVRLVSVKSNEPDGGLGRGDMPGDIQGWEPGTGDTAGLLRAERSAQGSGRTYTLTYQGSDQAGNVATCETTVTVPHDQRH